MKKRAFAVVGIIVLIILILLLIGKCSVETVKPAGESKPLTLELCKEQNKACEDEQQQAYKTCNEQYKDDHDAKMACWDKIAAVHGNVNTPFTCSLCRCVCTGVVLFTEETLEETIARCSLSSDYGKIEECSAWFDWAKP